MCWRVAFLPKLTEPHCFVPTKKKKKKNKTHPLLRIGGSYCYFNQFGYFLMNAFGWVGGLCCASEITYAQNCFDGCSVLYGLSRTD